MNDRMRSIKGSALLITLALMGMFTLIAIMALNNSTSDIELSFNKVHSEEAFYIAEAGAKKAISELKNNPAWRDTVNNVDFGKGRYSLVVQDSSTNATIHGDTVKVLANGITPNAGSAVEVTLTPKCDTLFKICVIGIDSVRAACPPVPSDKVRWWFSGDSDNPTAPADTGYDAIGSNGLIDGCSPTIKGDIETSMPNGITFGSWSNIYGDTSTQAAALKMPIISNAEYAMAEATSQAATGLSGYGGTPVYVYNPVTKSITVTAGATLKFAPGTYYFSKMILADNSTVTVDANSVTNIYVTDSLIIGAHVRLNKNGPPPTMVIYSKGPMPQFGDSCSIKGAIYAPETYLHISNYIDYYGSLVTRGITIDKGIYFRYDKALSRRSRTSPDLKVVAWREL